jgi:hypothetical protein
MTPPTSRLARSCFATGVEAYVPHITKTKRSSLATDVRISSRCWPVKRMLRARLGLENVAYGCTRSQTMQGIRPVCWCCCCTLTRKNSTRCSSRDPGKSGQARQTAKISGYGSVRARRPNCRA